jgi:hypothetical protein
MMDKSIFDRRRVLQLFALGSLAVPAVALVGCAQGSGATPPRRFQGGGNRGSERSGGGGGFGSGGNRGNR